MWAYRMVEWEHRPEAVDVAVPVPGTGEVLVRVAANGLCHSDITMTKMPARVGEAIGWAMPFTLGHEVAGHIAALGADASGVSVGDGVAIVSPSSCGTCRFCVTARDSLCSHGLVGRGYGRDGGLAEYVVVPVREVIPLGGFDPLAAGPLTDAGATSHHAVTRVLPRLVDGSTAVVIGVGGLGSFAVQLLRALSPARVIAVDSNERRRRIASELGAHEVFDGVDRGTESAIRRLTGGDGAEVVLDVVGTDDTIRAGLSSLQPGGAFGLVGAGGGSFGRPWFGGLPREAEVFTFQGSSIANAHAVVALARDGRIRSDVDVFGADRVTDAYAAMEAGSLRGRAVVTPPGAGTTATRSVA